MPNSKFEKFNDRILKTAVINLYKHLLDENSEDPRIYNLSDDEVFESIEYVIKLFGFGDGEYVDIDFIFALYELNYEFIKDGKIETDLIRPTLEDYVFEIEISERISKTVTYEHREKSYTSKNVIPINRRAEDVGDFSPWDGEITDTVVHNSETDDIEWLKPQKKLK